MAPLQLLGRGQAGLQGRRLQGGQEGLGDCFLDGQATDAHMEHAAAVLQPAGAAVIAGVDFAGPP